MTTKQKILQVVTSLPDDVSIDVAIDRLYLLAKIEQGVVEARTGQVDDHAAFMARLADADADPVD